MVDGCDHVSNLCFLFFRELQGDSTALFSRPATDETVNKWNQKFQKPYCLLTSVGKFPPDQTFLRSHLDFQNLVCDSGTRRWGCYWDSRGFTVHILTHRGFVFQKIYYAWMKKLHKIC